MLTVPECKEAITNLNSEIRRLEKIRKLYEGLIEVLTDEKTTGQRKRQIPKQRKTNPKLSPEVNDKIHKIIEENPGIQTSSIREKLGEPITSIQLSNRLSQLRQKSRIENRGNGGSKAAWYVKTAENEKNIGSTQPID